MSALAQEAKLSTTYDICNAESAIRPKPNHRKGVRSVLDFSFYRAGESFEMNCLEGALEGGQVKFKDIFCPCQKFGTDPARNGSLNIT